MEVRKYGLALSVVATLVVCAGLVVLTQGPRSERVELQSTANMGTAARKQLLPAQMRVNAPSATEITAAPFSGEESLAPMSLAARCSPNNLCAALGIRP